jgi:hypothetical protein
MRDGFLSHFSRAVRDVLSNTYRDQWTGRGGHTAWPPRSPDLTPLYSYLWGHLTTLVYAPPVDNEDALHRRIVDACQSIRNYTRISERIRRSMRHVVACAESHGGHFECTLSAISHKLNASGLC